MDKRHRILIVEDDVKIAALLADYFAAAGFDTRCLTDGLSAVDAVRAGGADLLILDLMLPQLDGIGVCRAVREFSQLPIIMLTARVDEVDRLLGLESGADDYVCKPFSPRASSNSIFLRVSCANCGWSKPPACPIINGPSPSCAS